MNADDLVDQLSHMIGEGLFPDKSSILSFCLSLGLRDRLREPGPITEMPEDFTEWEIWPLVQLIAADSEEGIEDMSQMKTYLLPFLNGGLEAVQKTTGKARGEKAVRKLIRLL